MEPRKLVCGLCGNKTYRLSINEEGVKVCDSCSSLAQNNKLNIDKPEVYIWVGQVARQGDMRMFIIPKSQKPFFEQKVKYSIIVRKLE